MKRGRRRVDYRWTNPGPGTVTVMSKAWQGPNGARWLATSPIEVPADGQEHKLQVFGVDGVCDEPHQTPLSLGLLVVTYPDGESKVIQKDEPEIWRYQRRLPKRLVGQVDGPTR